MMRLIRFGVMAACLLALTASVAPAASQTPARPDPPAVPTCLFVGPGNPPQTYAQLHAPMPTARHSFGTATLPGQTYVFAIGGMQSWETAVAANERFDACAGTWETLAPLPVPHGYVQAVEMNSFIYVVGGVTQVVSGTYQVDSTAFVYYPALDWWGEVDRLPVALGGVAVAAYQGKLYAFGGFDERGPGIGDINAAYEYSPASHQWSALPPMPGGARSLAGAAELNGELYVVGGMAGNTSGTTRVDAYNPTTGQWRTVASLGDARHSLTVLKSPDGYLYAAGGAQSFSMFETPQRYDPIAGQWEYLGTPRLNDYFDHAAAGAALTAGQLFVLGGIYPRDGLYNSGAINSNVNESMRVLDSICESSVDARPARIEPGGRITYTIELHPDVSLLPNVSLTDPLPAGTSFEAFVVQPPGAVFDAGQSRVEWQGSLTAGQAPITITFAVAVDEAGWIDGQPVTNTISINKGSGPLIQRSIGTPVRVFDLSPSLKWVDRVETPIGQTLTYTIRVQNVSNVSGTAALVDSIPIDTAFVTDSVTSTVGTAAYVDGQIVWNGSLPNPAAYTNISGDYQWGDSRGNGTLPGVEYDWMEIAPTGTEYAFFAPDNDRCYHTAFPFDFAVYGRHFTQASISTNGTLYFPDPAGYTNYLMGWDNLPIPSAYTYSGHDFQQFVAPLWDDLYLMPGRIYYQVLGAPPARRVVIEYANVARRASLTEPGDTGSFEMIFYEGSHALLMQYQDADFGSPLFDRGASATIGIQGSFTTGIQYGYHTPSLSDELAILYLPPGGAYTYTATFADIAFVVTTPLTESARITNTATITAGTGAVYERSALIWPVRARVYLPIVFKTLP